VSARLSTDESLCVRVLKGKFQRANITLTKLLKGVIGKSLITQAVGAIEPSPEKAGGGGSTPSLATITFVPKQLILFREADIAAKAALG
jgi:hypothetical protein